MFVLIILYIGIPVDIVALFISLVQLLVMLKGELSMESFKYKVVSGARGVSKCILRITI